MAAHNFIAHSNTRAATGQIGIPQKSNMKNCKLTDFGMELQSGQYDDKMDKLIQNLERKYSEGEAALLKNEYLNTKSQ